MSGSGYMAFVGDAMLTLALLMHSPAGYPARCGTCRTSWPCDRRRRLEALAEQAREDRRG